MYYNPKFRKPRADMRKVNRYDKLCSLYRLPCEKIRNDTAALRMDTLRGREKVRSRLLVKLRYSTIDSEDENGIEMAGNLDIVANSIKTNLSQDEEGILNDGNKLCAVKAKDRENSKTKQKQENGEPIMSLMMSLETVSDVTRFRDSEFLNHKNDEDSSIFPFCSETKPISWKEGQQNLKTWPDLWPSKNAKWSTSNVTDKKDNKNKRRFNHGKEVYFNILNKIQLRPPAFYASTMTPQVKTVLRRPAFYRVGNPLRMRLRKPAYYASSIASFSKALWTPKDFSCSLSYFVSSRTKVTPWKTLSQFAAMVLSKDIHPCLRISSSVTSCSSIRGAKAIDTPRDIHPYLQISPSVTSYSSIHEAKAIDTTRDIHPYLQISPSVTSYSSIHEAKAIDTTRDIHPCLQISSSVTSCTSIHGAKAIDITRRFFKGSTAGDTPSPNTPVKTINISAPSITKTTLKKTKQTLNKAFYDNSAHSIPQSASTDTDKAFQKISFWDTGSAVQNHFQYDNNLGNQKDPSMITVASVSENSYKITTQRAPLGISEPTMDEFHSSNADQEIHSHTTVPLRLKTSLTTVDQCKEKICSMLYEQSKLKASSTFTNAYIGQGPLVTFILPHHKVSIAETFIDGNTTGNAATEKLLTPIMKSIPDTSPKVTDHRPHLVCQTSTLSSTLPPQGTSSSKRALSMTFDPFIHKVPSKAVCLSSRAVSPMIIEPSIPDVLSITTSSSTDDVPSFDKNKYSTESRVNSQEIDLIRPVTNVSRSKANNTINTVLQSCTSVPFRFHGSKRLLQYNKSLVFEVNKHLSRSIPGRSFEMGLYCAFRKLRQYLNQKLKRLTRPSHFHSLSRRSATPEISIPRLNQSKLALLRKEGLIFPPRYLEDCQLRTNAFQKGTFKGYKRKNVPTSFPENSTPRKLLKDIFDNYDVSIVKRTRFALKSQPRQCRNPEMDSSTCSSPKQQSGSQRDKNTTKVNSISNEDDLCVYDNEMNLISEGIVNNSDSYPSDGKILCEIKTELASKDINTLPSSGLDQESRKQQNDLEDKNGCKTAVIGCQAELLSKDKNSKTGADDNVETPKIIGDYPKTVQRDADMSVESNLNCNIDNYKNNAIVEEEDEIIWDSNSSENDEVILKDGEESEGEHADSEAETSDDSTYPTRFLRKHRKQIRRRVGSRTSLVRRSRADCRPSRLSDFLEKVRKEDYSTQPDDNGADGDKKKAPLINSVNPSKINCSNIICPEKQQRVDLGQEISVDTTSKRKITETEDTDCNAATTLERIPYKKKCFKITGTHLKINSLSNHVIRS